MEFPKTLYPSTQKNIRTWINTPGMPQWVLDSIHKLLADEAWDELNDRFYKELEFGTGGMRGRTIGGITTPTERGNARPGETPLHAAPGSNTLNDINIIRATLGLFRYTQAQIQANERPDRIPSLVIAHDVRHFSRHFCLLTAAVWEELGGNAFIFDGPRSTPQLSFSVRYLGANAGVVITASHNPPHDNGYKVYFEDGAQVVSPHAEGIIDAVRSTELSEALPFLGQETQRTFTLSPQADQAYQDCIIGQLLRPEYIEKHPVKLVFSPIHGTGHVASLPALATCKAHVTAVQEQCDMDPNFSTVASPNPENAEALTLAFKAAEATQADLVLGTDPDADRMGAAIRNHDGSLIPLSGNQIGAMLGHYRIHLLQERGILNAQNACNAAFIKTFVTSPLQAAIAKKAGVKVIETLTGFKWIGKKLADYEAQLQKTFEAHEGYRIDYDKLDYTTRARYQLDHGTFYVFGGEESYGYLASDAVRDKDANAATLLFVELLSWLKSRNMKPIDYLEKIYQDYGYYAEKLVNIYFEGASGAQKIQNILNSYRHSPPKALSTAQVIRVMDFAQDEIKDADGVRIPKQDFFVLDLDNGFRWAVRASGTEPKIKFYCFGHKALSNGTSLASAKTALEAELSTMASELESDAHQRANA